jgi:DtxR family Mn-dependent transcriptional regulator
LPYALFLSDYLLPELRIRAFKGIQNYRSGRKAGIKTEKESQTMKISVRTENLDELLEMLWMRDEEGQIPENWKDPANLQDLVRQGESLDLLKQATGKALLTDKGKEAARQIIRRHRLTEMLLTELMDMPESDAESDACIFEHILSERATESVCTLLGHPPVCPHGKPIPRGECCEKFKKDLTPLVVPLSELNSGETARIVFIIPKSHARLDRLGSLGIVPGNHVRLHQKRPTFVLRVSETDIAIDSDIAGEIFVKRAF